MTDELVSEPSVVGMVERVGRAIEAEAIRVSAEGARWPGKQLTAGEYKDRLARAAIAAMREPTEAQYEALSATNKTWRELNSRTVWQTYIDAALAEDTA